MLIQYSSAKLKILIEMVWIMFNIFGRKIKSCKNLKRWLFCYF